MVREGRKGVECGGRGNRGEIKWEGGKLGKCS